MLAASATVPPEGSALTRCPTRKQRALLRRPSSSDRQLQPRAAAISSCGGVGCSSSASTTTSCSCSHTGAHVSGALTWIQPSSTSTCNSSSRRRRLARVLLCCSSSSEQPGQAAPWSITFDLRERETEWTDANKARLMAIVVSQRLGLPQPELEERLDSLANLLPDIGGNIAHLHPDIVTELVRVLPQIPGRLLALKDALPTANISALVTAAPRVLLQEPGQVAASAEKLRQLLRRQDVDGLVQAEPLFLSTDCVEEVLADMSRLLPQADVVALLVADPSWLLRVQRGQRWLGLPADWLPGEQIP